MAAAQFRMEIMDFVIKTVEAGYRSIVLTDTNGRRLDLVVDGDCCSNSHFDNDSRYDAEAMVGQTLRSIENRFVRSEDLDYGKTDIYFTVLTTDEGHTTLGWRNESNGYYGGWLSVSGDVPEVQVP